MVSTRTDADFWLNEATIANDVCDKNISTDSFLEIIQSEIDECLPLEGGNIIDLGCGYGRLTAPLAAKYTTSFVVGYDINPKFLKQAEENKGKADRPAYACSDSLPSIADADFVFSVQLFQHLSGEAKAEYIRQVYEVLKPGGVFLFQYVEGSNVGRCLYDAKLKDVETWCKAVGFEVTGHEFNLLAPRWTWIRAVKP